MSRPDDFLAPYSARILADEDRVLFEEARKAAKAGAWRAAYVMAWLSCAESLKRRFRELQPRDAAAGKIVGEINKKEQEKKSVDVYVLEQARVYGLIDAGAFLKLEHIYEQRCLYGHPYEESPSQEDLLAAASLVVDQVLSRPLLLREGFLSEQIKLLLTDKTFLDNDRAAVVEYAEDLLPRFDSSLLAWFMEKLWSEAEESAKGGRSLFMARCRWASVGMLKAIPVPALRALDALHLLLIAPIAGAWVLSDCSLFPHIKRQAQDKVIGILLDRAEKDSSSLTRVYRLSKAGTLSTRQSARFVEHIASEKVERLGRTRIPLEIIADRLLEELKSHNWYRQNPAIQVLDDRGRQEMFNVSDDTQRKLGQNVLQCADGGSRDARSFLERLADPNGDLWPVPFVHGIAEECFVNDRSQVRFKNGGLCAEHGLSALCRLKPEDRMAIVADIAGRIKEGAPKDDDFFDAERKKGIELLEELAESSLAVKKLFRPLRVALESVEVEPS